MKLPFVSRARCEALEREVVALRIASGAAERAFNGAISTCQDWQSMYRELMADYKALRVSGANAPEPEKVVPPPKRPPAIVYRAMRAISPRDDATFAANWRLWEENQDECEKDPTAFAERIKRGRMTPETPRAD